MGVPVSRAGARRAVGSSTAGAHAGGIAQAPGVTEGLGGLAYATGWSQTHVEGYAGEGVPSLVLPLFPHLHNVLQDLPGQESMLWQVMDNDRLVSSVTDQTSTTSFRVPPAWRARYTPVVTTVSAPHSMSSTVV